MISDFETNTVYFSKRLQTDPRYKKTAEKIFALLDSSNVTYKLLLNTNDIWARDYMPIQINEKEFIEYRYDPDYLQGASEGLRNLKTYPDIVCDTIGLKTKKSDLILDGGNIVKSSDCIILTNKVVKENQYSYSEDKLVKKLQETFQVDKVVLIPWDYECDYGHSDGMLRFIDDDTVLISRFYEQVDRGFKKDITTPLEEAKLNIKWLRCSKKEHEDNINYINFLQTNNLIIVPKLNKKTNDEQALKQISKYYPEYSKNNRIKQIDMTEIVKGGGALNCITWTTKELNQ